MAKLTENFTIEEMTFSQTAIRNDWDNTPSEKELKNLEQLCTKVLEKIRKESGNKEVIISSGFRGKKVNDAVGSKDTSQHPLGEAADFIIKGLTVKEAYEFIKKLVKEKKLVVDQCIIEYNRWIHISYTSRRPNRNQFLSIN
jgi:uncharacterized protein YcbK (DUF882 family)